MKNISDAQQLKDLYWTPDALFSYNRLLNFVIGGRNIGKTYGVKKWLVKRFLKTGAEFIYLRRYKTHLNADTVDSFFDKIALDEDFADVEFKVQNKQFFINGKVAGYALALSTWQVRKGAEFPFVETIMYDEFLKEKDTSTYLHNEPQALLNMTESIFREKLIVSDSSVRVVCLANKTTITNPFFTYFKILPKGNTRFNTFAHNKEILVEIPNKQDLSDIKAASRFGSLIQNTSYADISLENDFAYDTNDFIEPRPTHAASLFNLIRNGQTVGVYMDRQQSLLFVSATIDTGKTTYALTKEDFSEYTVYAPLPNEHYQLKRMRQAFSKGMIRYEDVRMRNFMYDVFNAWGMR